MNTFYQVTDLLQKSYEPSKCVVYILFIVTLFLATNTQVRASSLKESQTFPQKKITGIVTESENGKPLPGVTVLVRGSGNKGTVTDAKGKFSLTVSDTAVLIFRLLGFETATVPLQGKSEINISLRRSSKDLNEVVVVGYGQEKQRFLTESISKISSKSLNYAPAANVGNMLAGKTTGLTIQQSSGYPYSDKPSIYIRGFGDLSSGRSAPLILVDGVKRKFFHMDPHNIESISVLKDAAATSIYGIEGANGVILVTTKRGQKGPAKFSMDFSAGFQSPVRLPNFINSYTYATKYNEAQINDGVDPDLVRFSDEAIRGFKTHRYPLIYPDMDWVDYMLKPRAFQSQNHINISGGTDKVKYFVSGGFLRQSGLFKSYDVKFGNTFKDDAHYTRYNIRTNLDIDLTPSSRLSVTGYARYGTHTRLGQFANVQFKDIYRGSPFGGAGIHPVPPGYPKSYDKVLISGNSEGDSYYIPGSKYDPLKLFYGEGVDIYDRTSVDYDIEFRQKLNFITKGLSAQFKASYNTVYQKYKEVKASEPEFQAYFKTDVDPTAIGDSSIAYKVFYRSTPMDVDDHYSEGRDWYMEFRFDYRRKFGQHDLTGLLLYNQRQTFYPSTFTGYPRGLVGSVLRFKDTYHDRYMLEVNMGYNGSENFAKGKRFGLFPSFSGGWIVTEEPFMENIHFLNFLKLTASWGQVGSDVGQGRFLYIPDQYLINGQSSGGYNFGYNIPQNVNAAKQGQTGNPDVTWARSTKQDYGINMHLFDNQLRMRFEYFHEFRKNILSTLNTVPDYVNIPQLPPVNLGKVENHGYEAKVSWRRRVNPKLSYKIGAHITYARNKVIFKDEVPQPYPYLQETGHPIHQMFGYIFDRFYEPSDFDKEGNLLAQIPQPTYKVRSGDLKYKDLNADGVVDQYDQRAIGYPQHPEIMLGGQIGFSYKNFSVITIWQGATNVSRRFSGSPYRTVFGLDGRGDYGTFQWQIDGAWTPEKGQNATYPILTAQRASQRRNSMTSDFWIHDASYVRLKNAQISYDLPSDLAKRWGLQAIQVYVNGLNLVTFAPMVRKYSLNPEMYTSPTNSLYPLQRVVNVGVHLQF